MFKNLRQKFCAFILVVIIGVFGSAPFIWTDVSQAQGNPGGADLTHLELGDGKNSTEPKVGYLWTCRTEFANRGGASGNFPWLNGDGTWNSLLKLTVDGESEWSEYVFSVEVDGEQRVLTGNGLPDHPTGIFPIQRSDDAYQYDQNPNTISAQTVNITLPVNPTLADMPSCIRGMVGISLNGILIFDGFDAEGKDAPAREIQDSCGGHPQQSGQYHYHNLSPCVETYEESDTHSELVGYAFDGFGIYGYHGEDGKLMTNADLDECHGHTHEIEWEGELVEMFHYHATAEFPYTVGCFRGVAQEFGGGGMPNPNGNGNGQPGNPPNGGNGNGQPNGNNGQPPQIDFAAAAAQLGVTEQQLRDALGAPPPDFAAAAAKLGVTQQELMDALGVPPRQ